MTDNCNGSVTFPVIRGLHLSSLPCREVDVAMSSRKLNVTYEELLEAQKDSNVLIIDVREKDEIKETGKLPGSIHIPSRKLSSCPSAETFIHFLNVMALYIV